MRVNGAVKGAGSGSGMNFFLVFFLGAIPLPYSSLCITVPAEMGVRFACQEGVGGGERGIEIPDVLWRLQPDARIFTSCYLN